MARKFDMVAMLGDLTREKPVGRGEGRKGVFPNVFLFFVLGEVKNCCDKRNTGENGCPLEIYCWSLWDDFCDKEITDDNVISFLLAFKTISRTIREGQGN